MIPIWSEHRFKSEDKLLVPYSSGPIVGSSPVHKNDETDHISSPAEIDEIDYLSGRPSPDISVRGRMPVPEAIHYTVVREAGSVSELGEISVSAMPQDLFSGTHDRLTQYDVEPPRGKGKTVGNSVQTNKEAPNNWGK